MYEGMCAMSLDLILHFFKIAGKAFEFFKKDLDKSLGNTS